MYRTYAVDEMINLLPISSDKEQWILWENMTMPLAG